jgi:hypothetical protein
VRGCRRIEQTHNTSVETFDEFTEIKNTGFGKAGKMFFFKPAGVRRRNY